VLVVVGDWLFYGNRLGLSLPLFFLAVAAGSYAVRSKEVKVSALPLALGILVMMLLPLLEATSVLAIVFGLMGTAVFVVMIARGLRQGLVKTLQTAVELLLEGMLELIPDLRRIGIRLKADGAFARGLGIAAGWVIPLGICLVFGILFTIANPLLEAGLRAIDPLSWLRGMQIRRILLWALLLLFCWPFLKARLRTVVTPRITPSRMVLTVPAAIALRSLILCNALFALQTILDGLYLWGGAALPAGMTYAAYAHRGAYPLIVTALLAGGLVLLAMRPGSSTERSAIIRTLVFLWVGQNVLLVVSSIARLDLYVEVYALTYLRAAAFIWMGLVAAGLVLIVIRIARGYSNSWLVTANAMVLIGTLYTCSFINFPDVIASYNVSHSSDGGQGDRPLHAPYLLHLGPQAIPALDRYLAVAPDGPSFRLLSYGRGLLRVQHEREAQEWRGWTFRGWRLQQYLANHANQAGPAPEAPAAGGAS
jgi:hypothetical protein